VIGRRQSLRTQLVWGNILTLALLLGALGIVVRVTVRSTIMASVDSELEHRTHPHEGRPPPNGMSPPEALPPPDDRPPPPEGWSPPFGAPRDTQNTPFSAQPPAFGQPPPGSPFSGGPPGSDLGRPRHYTPSGQATEGPRDEAPRDPAALAQAAQGQTVYSTVASDVGPLRVITRPDSPSRPVTSITQAAYPLADVERAMAGLDRALLILLPLGLLGAGLGGVLLTGRVLGRVRQMAQAAERVGGEDMGERLPVAGHDEFADLAATFNAVLERLEHAFHKQRRLMEQQRRFTADASHELKTPLTIIKGNTSMALLTTPPGDPALPTFQQIDTAADTMSSLVQDLLLLARSDDGQLARNPVSLLVREVLERAIARTPQPHPPIYLHVADEALTVRGNEGELVRLFGNLLDNAARYASPEGRIDATAACADGHIVVTIADTGAGISPEHLAHLGERFYRADAARARTEGGTGLGLSIVQGIARAHGGRLDIQSAVGVGTTVRITLPADV